MIVNSYTLAGGVIRRKATEDLAGEFNTRTSPCHLEIVHFSPTLQRRLVRSSTSAYGSGSPQLVNKTMREMKLLGPCEASAPQMYFYNSQTTAFHTP